MAGTHLNFKESQVVIAIINRSYLYKEDDEAAELMSNHVHGVANRDTIESLKSRGVLVGYGEEMRVRYEYYVSACTQCDLTKSFMDLDNPTENELVIFELEYGFKLRKTMIGQYVYDEAEIYNR